MTTIAACIICILKYVNSRRGERRVPRKIKRQDRAVGLSGFAFLKKNNNSFSKVSRYGVAGRLYRIVTLVTYTRDEHSLFYIIIKYTVHGVRTRVCAA